MTTKHATNRFYPRAGLGAGPWDRTGTLVHLDSSTDRVAIGTATPPGTEKLFIVNDVPANVVLRARGAAAQSGSLLRLEDSGGTALVVVDATGIVTASNLKTHALIEDRAPNDTRGAGGFINLRTSAAIIFSGRPLLVFLDLTLFSTIGLTAVEFAIQIDAGADAVIGKLFLNTAGIHETVGGAVIVTPAAGSHTISLRWRRASGTGILTLDNGDQILVYAVEL